MKNQRSELTRSDRGEETLNMFMGNSTVKCHQNRKNANVYSVLLFMYLFFRDMR